MVAPTSKREESSIPNEFLLATFACMLWHPWHSHCGSLGSEQPNVLSDATNAPWLQLSSLPSCRTLLGNDPGNGYVRTIDNMWTKCVAGNSRRGLIIEMSQLLVSTFLLSHARDQSHSLFHHVRPYHQTGTDHAPTAQPPTSQSGLSTRHTALNPHPRILMITEVWTQLNRQNASRAKSWSCAALPVARCDPPRKALLNRYPRISTHRAPSRRQGNFNDQRGCLRDETRTLQFQSCSVPAEAEGRVWFDQEWRPHHRSWCEAVPSAAPLSTDPSEMIDSRMDTRTGWTRKLNFSRSSQLSWRKSGRDRTLSWND